MNTSHVFSVCVLLLTAALLHGQTPNNPISITWSVPSGTLRFSATQASVGLNGFNGALGYDSPRSFFGNGAMVVQPSECKPVLLRLATVNFTGDYNPPFNPADPNVSFGYRYLRAATAAPANPSFAPYIINPSAGYAYQDFSQNVPLSAWDVSDPLNPKRLAVGFLENNTASGLVDGKYWPGSDQSYDNAAASGPREWLFIFDQPYSTTVHSNYTQDIFSGTAQRVMYMATWNRIHQATFSPVGPPEDRFLINPSLATSVRSVTDLPMTSSLDNNYPNPFNPTTTIPFTLPSSVFVTLRVFDVLGREVSTLVSEQLSAGNHAREFNSVGMSSGIYFYRLQAGSFTQTKKMTLIK